MMDIQVLNSVQQYAVQTLLEEVFTHIAAATHESYQALGKTNARLQLTTETRFISNGVIYPPSVTNTLLYGAHLPTLHLSLLSELDAINNMAAQSDYHYIKNFFVAVISQSHNSIVLDALLPAALLNRLKEIIGSANFKVIDSGVYGALQQEPISITQQTIQDIKTHYKNTIATLQRLLMDKWLLHY